MHFEVYIYSDTPKSPSDLFDTVRMVISLLIKELADQGLYCLSFHFLPFRSKYCTKVSKCLSGSKVKYSKCTLARFVLITFG